MPEENNQQGIMLIEYDADLPYNLPKIAIYEAQQKISFMSEVKLGYIVHKGEMCKILDSMWLEEPTTTKTICQRANKFFKEFVWKGNDTMDEKNWRCHNPELN